MINLNNQLSNIIEKFSKIENSLSNINNTSSENLIKLNKEYADLKPIVEKINEYNTQKNEIKNLQDLISDKDPDISKIAEVELFEKKKK